MFIKLINCATEAISGIQQITKMEGSTFTDQKTQLHASFPLVLKRKSIVQRTRIRPPKQTLKSQDIGSELETTLYVDPRSAKYLRNLD